LDFEVRYCKKKQKLLQSKTVELQPRAQQFTGAKALKALQCKDLNTVDLDTQLPEDRRPQTPSSSVRTVDPARAKAIASVGGVA
jgi:hypothetical protein